MPYILTQNMHVSWPRWGGGVERDQKSDIRPPKKSNIRYQGTPVPPNLPPPQGYTCYSHTRPLKSSTCLRASSHSIHIPTRLRASSHSMHTQNTNCNSQDQTLGGCRSPAVACWASDHWVASSNPLRVINFASLSPASAWPSLA